MNEEHNTPGREAEERAEALKRMRYEELRPIVEFQYSDEAKKMNYGFFGLKGTGKELRAICRDLKKYGYSQGTPEPIVVAGTIR